MPSVLGVSTPALSPSATPQPRLVQAAHEFEAQMMKEILKPLTGNGVLSGFDDDPGGGSNSALSEFASEALGKALSQSGGFGIANSLIRDLSHSGNGREIGTVTASRHDNTPMRATK
jgi:Rod binding domain-containing protein